jgi:hypothetical protein
MVAKEIQRWAEEAHRYPEAQRESKIYQPGNYPFTMKSGEITDHWIRPVRGIRTVLKWASSNGSFKVEQRDGTFLDVSKPKGREELGPEFRIHALDDTFLLLRIIEE